jgi:large subunit ribosomal protein L24
MKKFSKHWKSSKKPKKQNKYRANAPLHVKRKMLHVQLSKELRKKYGMRNITINKGDTVKVMKGKFKKKQGKVTEVNTKRLRIFVEGVQVKKQDGSKANVFIRPSNLQIIELNFDKKRSKIERMKKNKKEEKTEKVTEEKK